MKPPVPPTRRRVSTGRRDWATRKDVASLTFNAPVHVPELDTASTDQPTWISADECVIYLQSTRNAAELKIYRAIRPK